MNEKTTVTDAAPTKSNGWKIAKDITIALAPTIITVAACALIVKQLDKD